MVAGIVKRVREGRQEVLIVKQTQPPDQHNWSFPGGEVQSRESPEAALRRILKDGLNVSVEIKVGQPPFDEQVGDQIQRWRYFFCDSSPVDASEAHAATQRWVQPGGLREYEFEPVSRRVVDWLLETGEA